MMIVARGVESNEMKTTFDTGMSRQVDHHCNDYHHNHYNHHNHHNDHHNHHNHHNHHHHPSIPNEMKTTFDTGMSRLKPRLTRISSATCNHAIADMILIKNGNHFH